MSEFLRRHLFVVLGLSLPLLLVLVVVGTQIAGQRSVAPPTTPILYVQQPDYYLMSQFEFEVADGRLRVRYQRPANVSHAASWRPPVLELWLFDPVDESLEPYELRVSGDVEREQWVDVALPAAVAALRLDASLVSPDGFRFEAYRRGRGGLFGELFGYSSYGTRFRLVKDGAHFTVPGNGAYAGQQAFIGWVIDDE